MKRLITVVVVLVTAAGLSACEKTEYVEQMDAGVQEDAGQDDAAPQCGPDTYPCPPYGTVPNTVMENLTFTGWVDENSDGDPLTDPYRTWGLDYFYQLGKAGQAKFLMLNASAGWCTVCRAETRTLNALQADYLDQGVRLAQILFEDNEYNPATKQFVQDWETTYKLTFPIGLDAAFKTGRYFDIAATPANFVIALRDMTVNGVPVKAMEMMTLMTGYSETELRALLDDFIANSE
ncbi:MAG: TlpA family protein disulfide reductase [Deltaproteobacteria bacterium]|nr:TlpA family protein disulfide reductase [Deltaproteobacteria bacterium]